MKDLARAKFGSFGVVRRLVALLAITAWMLGIFVCPNDSAAALGATHYTTSHETPGGTAHGAAAPGVTQPAAAHGNHDGGTPPRPDVDPSCQVLAHTSGVLQATAAVPADRSGGLELPRAVISSVSAPTPAGCAAIGTDRFFGGPPRTRSAGFATFWSRAPPAL